MPSWATSDQFWYSFVAVLVVVMAVVITHFGFRRRVEPKIIVYLREDDIRPDIILIVIENVGNGAARNVQFTIDGDLPARAFATDDSFEPMKMAGGPLVKGIDSLAPGAKRLISWGRYDGLRRAIGDRSIGVTARYRGRAVGRWQSEVRTTTSTIDGKTLASAVGRSGE